MMKKGVFFVMISLFTINSFEQRYVKINKAELRLSVLEGEEELFSCSVAIGRNIGNKEKNCDMKTPEGTFAICSIEDSSNWKHDFNDGKGLRKGAYGPFFFRLKVPGFNGIGIHGTCKPESIGTRDSEGCIRLNNADLMILRQYVYINMSVIITKDEYGK